jgi:hypothetical protein
MATITTGHNAPTGFSSGEVVTATKLNNHVNSATVTAIQTADISDAQITTAKIADDAVTAAKLDGVSSLNTQTDNYTLVLGDAGRVIDMNAATDKTVTIPTNATAAFATGATVLLARRGAGEVTVSGASGVTVRSASTTFTSVTGTAAGATPNVLTVAGSAFTAGQVVRFTALTGGAGLSTNTDYYVISPSTTTFKLSATSGGSEIDFTTDITAGTLTANTKRVSQQHGVAALIKLATDEWMLFGNLKP